MNPNIIHREIIVLPEKQLQMLRSGWGSAAIDDTFVEAIVYMSDGYEVQGDIAYPKKSPPRGHDLANPSPKRRGKDNELTDQEPLTSLVPSTLLHLFSMGI
ncbi:MAG: hypothetical protein IPJ75_16310 [Ignavibacteriales bacterium]|nr:hypothetical protein [Ignavibacteriales bacterium]